MTLPPDNEFFPRPLYLGGGPRLFLPQAPAPFRPSRYSLCSRRLRRLRALHHFRPHFPHRFVRARAVLFPPRLQPLALFFHVREHLLASEHGPPRSEHGLHLFPHHPLFATAFEEQVFVDQSAVHDARHHLPIPQHHPHVRVFLAPGRTQPHHVLRARHVKVRSEPVPRLAQFRLAPLLVQPQHQVHLLVCYFSHDSSFSFVLFGLSDKFFPPFGASSLLTTTAATPPVETAEAISIAVAAMHAGHIRFVLKCN